MNNATDLMIAHSPSVTMPHCFKDGIFLLHYERKHHGLCRTYVHAKQKQLAR